MLKKLLCFGFFTMSISACAPTQAEVKYNQIASDFQSYRIQSTRNEFDKQTVVFAELLLRHTEIGCILLDHRLELQKIIPDSNAPYYAIILSVTKSGESEGFIETAPSRPAIILADGEPIRLVAQSISSRKVKSSSVKCNDFGKTRSVIQSDQSVPYLITHDQLKKLATSTNVEYRISMTQKDVTGRFSPQNIDSVANFLNDTR